MTPSASDVPLPGGLDLPNSTQRVALLHELLDTASCAGPEYGPGYASHLPMALQALHALGADEPRLRSFLQSALPCFEPLAVAPLPAPLTNWPAHRGAMPAYRVLLAHFLAALDAQGRDAVLRQSLPFLLTGVAAAAFHGLIRTAHAVEAGHAGELASALAYWACRWMPLPRGEGMGVCLDFPAWQAGLHAEAGVSRVPGQLISAGIAQVVRGPAYQALAGRLPGSPETLTRLSALAAAGYAHSRDFTLLHLLTGGRALRVLLPWFPDPDDAIGAFSDAFAAAWLTSGVEAPPPAAAGNAAPWPDIVARALCADNEHVIKLVHAALAEATVHPDEPVYQSAAWRAVRPAA
jgi:Questin oxidase-like